MRVVAMFVMLVLLSGMPSGGAVSRAATAQRSIHVLDLVSPAMTLNTRNGSCTRESEVALPDRPGAYRVRCTRTLIVYHSPVQGRDTTIVFWDPKHIEKSLSVAGKLDGDRLLVSAVAPDNGGVAFPASGICRLQKRVTLVVEEPGVLGSNPFDNIGSFVCTADSSGKRVLHVAFEEQQKTRKITCRLPRGAPIKFSLVTG